MKSSAGEHVAKPNRVAMRHWGIALLAAAMSIGGGCSREDKIDSVHGRRSGTYGGGSVNGTAVLGKMFEKAGYRVTTWHRLSPTLDRADVIVWTPDNFHAPSAEERQYLERWLSKEIERTLVYVGRDYDATITYWEKIAPTAPPEEAREVARRLAEAKSSHHLARAEMPDEEYARWFTARGDRTKRSVRTLEGPWSRGIDAAKVEIQLQGTLDIPQINDQPLGETSEELPQVEVLLKSQGDPLVTRLRPPNVDYSDYYYDDYDDLDGFTDGKIIVVANGSFLLNVPLVNHEHRKLAGKLIEECGSPDALLDRHVVFLESGASELPIVDNDSDTMMPTGFEAFTVWPLNFVALHAAALGILYCLAKLPIFGRPRQLTTDALSDFGRHIDALGDALARTGDVGYASSRLAHYRQTVGRDAGGGTTAAGQAGPKKDHSGETTTAQTSAVETSEKR